MLPEDLVAAGLLPAREEVVPRKADVEQFLYVWCHNETPVELRTMDGHWYSGELRYGYSRESKELWVLTIEDCNGPFHSGNHALVFTADDIEDFDGDGMLLTRGGLL